MEIGNLMSEALSNCILVNGKLMLGRTFNKEELLAIYSQLSKDLLDCNIPHYRVFAIWMAKDPQIGESMFRNSSVYGCSIIELGHRSRLLVPMEIVGNDPETGCFHGVEEEVPNNNPNFISAHGITLKVGGTKQSCGVFNINREEFGCLMSDPILPHIGADDASVEAPMVHEVNPKYMMKAMSGCRDFEHVPPKMLIPDVKLADINDVSIGGQKTLFFYKLGTGELSYEEAQKLFIERDRDRCRKRVDYT